MAKAKKAPVVELEVEEIDEDETAEDTEEETQGIRPKDLAKELEISAKALRSYLRKEFPRSSTEKNTSWYLTDEQADSVRAHYLEEDDADEENDESDED